MCQMFRTAVLLVATIAWLANSGCQRQAEVTEPPRLDDPSATMLAVFDRFDAIRVQIYSFGENDEEVTSEFVLSNAERASVREALSEELEDHPLMWRDWADACGYSLQLDGMIGNEVQPLLVMQGCTTLVGLGELQDYNTRFDCNKFVSVIYDAAIEHGVDPEIIETKKSIDESQLEDESSVPDDASGEPIGNRGSQEP